MTTRSVSRVWMGSLLRGITALTPALTAAVVAGMSAAAASAPVDLGGSRPARPAVHAGGRPPVPRDDRLRATRAPTASPRPSRGDGVTACPSPPTAVRTAARSGRRRPAAATASPCPVSTPSPTLVARRPPVPTAPVTAAAPTPTSRPEPAAASGPPPAASPAPHPDQPLPVPPPLGLTPSLVPVPQSDAAQLAPTSVLTLGFGSVALATAAMTLRLLRRGR